VKLEDLRPQAVVRGVLPDRTGTVVNVQWSGTDVQRCLVVCGEQWQDVLYRWLHLPVETRTNASTALLEGVTQWPR
jgi:hypothetical protein